MDFRDIGRHHACQVGDDRLSPVNAVGMDDVEHQASGRGLIDSRAGKRIFAVIYATTAERIFRRPAPLLGGSRAADFEGPSWWTPTAT
jgi:hypothetical protein